MVDSWNRKCPSVATIKMTVTIRMHIICLVSVITITCEGWHAHGLLIRMCGGIVVAQIERQHHNELITLFLIDFNLLSDFIPEHLIFFNQCFMLLD